MRTIIVIPLLLAALSFGGCGGTPEREPAAAPTAAATGPGLSIEDALASDLPGPLLVNGYLLADGDTIRLCSGYAESHPPQCAEPSLEVLGYKLLEQRRLYKTSGSVFWSEEPVQLLGVVEDGTLTVSENAQS
jgi:hypothetical protein